MTTEEIICHSCGFANSTDVLFCRKCGTRTHEDSDEPERVLVLPENPKHFNTGVSLTRIGLGLVGAFFLLMFVAIILPFGSRRGHRSEHGREKACYANMRVILGAVEMYNMDHTSMINDLRDRDATSEDGILIQGKYLKSPISRPETKCRYSGYNLSSDGQIVCEEHGTVEGNND
ncbi:MAG: hypothetical protein ACOYXC_10120 [Candidatus Rifleibacteriota bacterium]